ncbi:MAG: hypothetical protein MMC33_007835 [Icmadophila ericetorum]|nr:hypothetical protein [Icmadophila ericetorum]
MSSASDQLPERSLTIIPMSLRTGWWITIFQDYFNSRLNHDRMICKEGHNCNYMTYVVQTELPEHMFASPGPKILSRHTTPRSVFFHYSIKLNNTDFASYGWLGSLMEVKNEGEPSNFSLYWRHEDRKKLFRYTPKQGPDFLEISIGGRRPDHATTEEAFTKEILVIFERQALTGVLADEMAARCPTLQSLRSRYPIPDVPKAIEKHSEWLREGTESG